MEIILTQLLSDELNAGNPNAVNFMKIFKQPSKDIDDLLLLIEYGESVDIVESVIEELTGDMIDEIKLEVFIKEVDYLLQTYFKGASVKQVKRRQLLENIKVFLVNPSSSTFDIGYMDSLIQLMMSVKDEGLKHRLKFILFKIHTLLEFKDEGSSDSDPLDESEESSESDLPDTPDESEDSDDK